MENDWQLPSGFRFCPTDKELLIDYLHNKINNLPLPCDFVINNVRLYDYTPDQLAATYDDWGQKQWYFFTVRDKKYKGGRRPNRALATGDGHWKATNAGGPVRDGGVVVGHRRSLVFYQGNNKTNWLMNEYYIENPQTPNAAENSGMHLDLALCRIYNKDYKKGGDLPAPLSHQCPASAPPLQNLDVLSDNTPENYFLQPRPWTPLLQNSDVLSDDIPQSPPSTPLLQNLDLIIDNIPESYFLQPPPLTPPLQNADVLSTQPLQNLDFSSDNIPESYFPKSPESSFPQPPASALPPSHHSIYWSSGIPGSSPQSPASSVLPPAQHSMHRNSAIPENSCPESPASLLPPTQPSMYCSKAIPKSECPQSPVSVLPPAQPSMYCSNAIPKSECPQSPASVLPPAQPSMYCSNAVPKSECPQSPA